MALDADRWVDRRRLKRSLTAWRLIALAAVVAAVLGGLGRIGANLPLGGDFVARVAVDGLILTMAERDRLLAEVAENPRARALLVRIDSPGGTVAGSEALYGALRRVAAEKPVVAVMAEVAASGGYMVALGADHILARAGTITGSIGVLFQTADLSGLLEKIGIRADSVKSGPLKGEPNPLEPMTPEVRRAIESVVLDSYGLFVDMVAERRGMAPATARALADGRIYTGRQAQANGLVDALGGEEEARAWLAERHGVAADLPVREFAPAEESFAWPTVVHWLFGKALSSERLRLDGLIAVWQPSGP